MSLFDKLFEWLELQDKDYVDTVLFELLYLAPDYDIHDAEILANPYTAFKNYVNKDLSSSKCVGKLLYIIKAIDLITIDYDNVDSLIDSQNLIKEVIKHGEEDGRDMSYMRKLHSDGNEKYELRKSFKYAWEEFRDAYLDFEAINQLLRDYLRNRR